MINKAFKGINEAFKGINKAFKGIDKAFKWIKKAFTGINKPFKGINKASVGRFPICSGIWRQNGPSALPWGFGARTIVGIRCQNGPSSGLKVL